MLVPLSILALPCLHCWSLHHLGAIFKSSYILSILMEVHQEHN
jgi:hypothetical protein